MGFACDVTDEAGAAAAIQAIENRLGTPDILFNNAGININGGALDLDYLDWKRVLDVNVNGVFLMARAFARHCVAAGKPGSVINNASISASIVNLSPVADGLQHLQSRSAAYDPGARRGMGGSAYPGHAISPGYVWTEMNQVVPEEITSVWLAATPFKRFAKPDEIAGAVIYYASDASTYTSGSELKIDGCFTCL